MAELAQTDEGAVHPNAHATRRAGQETGHLGGGQTLNEAQTQQLAIAWSEPLVMREDARRSIVAIELVERRAVFLCGDALRGGLTLAEFAALPPHIAPQLIARDAIDPHREIAVDLEARESEPSGEEDLLVHIGDLIGWQHGAQQGMHRRPALFVETCEGLAITRLCLDKLRAQSVGRTSGRDPLPPRGRGVFRRGRAI